MIAIVKFLLVLLYIVACGVLIFSVLLQQGKGASLGASLGGGASQTVFGSRTSNFMTRATSVMAGVFMVLALVLAKYPPFGTDSSSDVRDILTPETVEAADPAVTDEPAATLDPSAPVTEAVSVTIPPPLERAVEIPPADAVAPAAVDVSTETADVLVPLELVPAAETEAEAPATPVQAAPATPAAPELTPAEAAAAAEAPAGP